MTNMIANFFLIFDALLTIGKTFLNSLHHVVAYEVADQCDRFFSLNYWQYTIDYLFL